MKCPVCGHAAIVRGHMHNAFGDYRFHPNGLRWFVVRRSTGLRDPWLTACTNCGHVWGESSAVELRMLIDASAGTDLLDELRRRAKQVAPPSRTIPAGSRASPNCPCCDDPVTVAGDFAGKHEATFVPDRLRFLTWGRRATLIPLRSGGLVRACTSCGHVWTAMDPASFRSYLSACASDELRNELQRLGANLP